MVDIEPCRVRSKIENSPNRVVRNAYLIFPIVRTNIEKKR